VLLYLHGFASGPESYKGRAFEDYLAPRGYQLQRLDLRVPDRNGLRVSAMVDRCRRAADEHRRVAIIGSSLGGLVAAHVAAHDERVLGAVAMAPAFGFAARWARSFGPSGLARWKSGIPLRVEDHAGGGPLAVDYGFYEDVAELEQGWAPMTASGWRRGLPMLAFHGCGDETVDIATTRAFAAAHAEVELVELDDGHTLIESLPTMLPRSAEFLDGLFRLG
jgi:pimeloyl-ACP methyl ester carboxylesterase